METKVNKYWGWRVISQTSLNFYHILLPQIGIRFLARNLTNYKEIELKEDKSVVITTQTPLDLELITRELENLLVNMESQFAQTGNFSYKIYPFQTGFLKNWFLAIEGAVALVAVSACEALRLKPYDFELINSEVGGIYIHPFTILFYENYAKVIHPIRVSNFFLREQVERVISVSMRGILQRAGQSRPGYEGLAIGSYVQEKTKLPYDDIVRIINEKAQVVRTPKYSPLFK